MLANRIKRVLKGIVLSSQTTFVSGRQILDGVLALEEIINHARKEKKERFILKEDFQQAYDSVNWNLLRGMLQKFGFGIIWCRWMEACIFKNSMLTLVNGSPTKDFRVERGLRQGDPFSPFLFTLVVEGLVGLVQKAAENGGFKGYKVNSELEINLLQFADDTVIMGKGFQNNLWSIKAISGGLN